MRQTAPPPDDPVAVARLERQVLRLEALAARRRYRIAGLRALRGVAGGTLALLAAVKLKLAASLTLKLGLALAVGLAVAWPAYALAAILLAGVVAAIVTCEELPCDGTYGLCDCAHKEKRRARLDQLIDERRALLHAASAAIRSEERPDPTAR